MPGTQLSEEAAAAQDPEISAQALVPATLQTGVVAAGKDSPGWKLLDGEGPRWHEVQVTFPQAFRFQPTVRVMLTGSDILDGANHRLTAYPTEITKGGFKLMFHTWANTRVWSVAVTWMAHSS